MFRRQMAETGSVFHVGDRASTLVLPRHRVAAHCIVRRRHASPIRPLFRSPSWCRCGGRGNDIMARLIAQHLGRALGQQFVIEDRPAAGGLGRARGRQGRARIHADGRPFRRVRRRPALYADPGYAAATSRRSGSRLPSGVPWSIRRCWCTASRIHCACPCDPGKITSDGRRRLRLPSLDRIVRSWRTSS